MQQQRNGITGDSDGQVTEAAGLNLIRHLHTLYARQQASVVLLQRIICYRQPTIFIHLLLRPRQTRPSISQFGFQFHSFPKTFTAAIQLQSC